MSSSFLKDLFIYDRGREMPARGIIKRIRRYFCRAKAQRYKYPYKSVHHIITPPSALVKLFFRFLRNSRICAPKAPRRAFFGLCAATGILHIIFLYPARGAPPHIGARAQELGRIIRRFAAEGKLPLDTEREVWYT